MFTSALAMLALTATLSAGEGSKPPVPPFESAADLKPANKIDEVVFARLKQLGIPPASLCSDAVFVRRVYLDVLGTLPAAREARQFLEDKSANKRSVLIDQLLGRKEFADYWAMKWGDLLRIKAEFPINLWPHAAQAYHHWVRMAIQENMPYDRFVREMLTSSGSNFRVPPVNFYRAVQSRQPQALAQAVALTFMGARIEKWPPERQAGMAVFFAKVGYKATGEWKEEIVFFDPAKSDPKNPITARPLFPDGAAATLPPDRDGRAVFADWLIDSKNSKNLWFARNIVNRVWFWLQGRGIVNEADDLRPDNPPSNPELLALLEHELVASHYDLKHIYRLILNSKTYQLSSIARSQRPEAEANFAFYPLRRLEAEVLIDAICQITGTTEKYSSPIPEPYTFLPEGHRAIALPDGSISSSFLETFGKPARDSGLESERNNRTTAAQRLHMLNSSHIQSKLEQSAKLAMWISPDRKPREVVAGLYLMILSRYPTEEDLQAMEHYASGPRRREAALDLAWALINSAEFMYRH
jgi:hypothetical protein